MKNWNLTVSYANGSLETIKPTNTKFSIAIEFNGLLIL